MSPQELGQALASADRALDVQTISSLAASRAVSEFARQQLEALRGPPEEELRERAGRRHREVAGSIAAAAKRIMKGVYQVATLEEMEALDPRELLARALADRYETLPRVAHAPRHFVGTVGVREDLAYGVFEVFPEGVLPEALEIPGVRRPHAMTFVREGDGWLGVLDGALPVDAVNVFLPGW